MKITGKEKEFERYAELCNKRFREKLSGDEERELNILEEELNKFSNNLVF